MKLGSYSSLITITWNKSFHLLFKRTNVLQYEVLGKKIFQIITLMYSNRTWNNNTYCQSQKRNYKNAHIMSNVLQPWMKSMLPARLLKYYKNFHYLGQYCYSVKDWKTLALENKRMKRLPQGFINIRGN